MSTKYVLLLQAIHRYYEQTGREPKLITMSRKFHRELMVDMDAGESIDIERDGTYVAHIKIATGSDLIEFLLSS